MKIWLKQLFCTHIYKNGTSKELGSGTTYYHNIPISGYVRYALNQCCIKCKKLKIIEVTKYHDLPIV